VSAIASRTLRHQRKALPLKLPSEIALDLQAFCEAHHGAPQNRVITKAVDEFIKRELKDDPVTRSRFDQAKERIVKELSPTDSLHLVSPKK
jgi:hypothetical protein